MDSPRIARRAALGAIIAGPALAGVTSVAATAAASTTMSGWWAAKAQLDSLQQNASSFYTTVLQAAYNAAAGEAARLPHTVIAMGNGDWRTGVEATSPVSTADLARVGHYRQKLTEVDRDDLRCANPDTVPNMRRLVAAADARAEALTEINDRHRVFELEEESGRLDDLVFKAERRLLAMPAPDSAALLWKLELVLERDANGHCLDAVKADARRLLGREG